MYNDTLVWRVNSIEMANGGVPVMYQAQICSGGNWNTTCFTGPLALNDLQAWELLVRAC